MGSNHAVDGKVMQGLLDEKSKEVDRLTVKNDIYQLVILEEMQNPTLLSGMVGKFENRYNNYANVMITKFNNQMGNNNYLEAGNHVGIINIIFHFESQRVNVVTPTDFRLKNIYAVSLNKLNDKEPYVDIDNMLFKFNADDITTHFINNHEISVLHIPDQAVIEIIRKNNVTINSSIRQ